MIEHRAASLEVRAKGRRLEGYAATFGTPATIGDFTEIIAPRAFAGSLGGDIVGLLDHDVAKLLGRTSSGTLQLLEDDHGLHFDLDIPNTSAGNDALALAERGDLGGCSFGFTVTKEGQRWEGNRRTLTAIDLKEVSIVSSWPAYSGTSVTARAIQGGNTTLIRLALARRYVETLTGGSPKWP